MDVILASAGIHGAAQQQVCVNAVRNEVQQTQRQLDAALSALQRLLRVAKLASDAGERSSLAHLAPDVAQQVEQMLDSERIITARIQELHAVVHTSSLPETQERIRAQEHRAEPPRPHVRAADTFSAQGGQEKTEPRPPGEARALHGTSGRTRARSPPQQATSFLRPFTSESESSEEEVRDVKRQAVEIDGRRFLVSRRRQPPYQTGKSPLEKLTARLNGLPPGNTSPLFKTALEAAIEIAKLDNASGSEQCIPRCLSATRTALRFFLAQHKSFPDGGLNHFEDIRQTLITFIRAIQLTEGRLEAAAMRDLLSLLIELQRNPIAPATRTSWCRASLQKFMTKYYVKPAEEAASDQQKLEATLGEVRGWKARNDFSVARLGIMMGLVRKWFQGKYEDWEPPQDPRVALLTQLLNSWAMTFPDSDAQSDRLYQFKEWHREMPSTAFVSTLDLVLVPPLSPSAMAMNPRRLQFDFDDIEAGFKFVGHMMDSGHLDSQVVGIIRFLVFVTSTCRPPQMSVAELRRLNKHIGNLCVLPNEEINLDTAHSLEKILFMMRIVMRKQPEYEELSASAVDVILSFFPSSTTPKFIYPSKIPSS